MTSIEVNLDTESLDAAIATFSHAFDHAIKVGVLERTNARDDGQTNAEVGANSEYGVKEDICTTEGVEVARGRDPMCWSGIPVRSFLRVPIGEHLGPELAKESKIVGKVIEGKVEGVTLADVVGVIAVRTVDDAFATGGFGQWQPNSERTTEWKGSSQPLIDSNQLRDSIAYDLVPA